MALCEGLSDTLHDRSSGRQVSQTVSLNNNS